MNDQTLTLSERDRIYQSLHSISLRVAALESGDTATARACEAVLAALDLRHLNYVDLRREITEATAMLGGGVNGGAHVLRSRDGPREP